VYNQYMIKPKSLVTGGAGFIGSNLVDALLKLGHDVIVIDNESSEVHDHFYWNSLASNHKLDIRDYESTRELYDNVDYVFHLAAQSRIQPAINSPIEAVSINSVGTATVLQCSLEAKVKRVIYSSTSSAYGNNPTPNVETQPNDCLNPYSVSKVAGENLCIMYNKLFGLPTIVFRYFNVYGNRQPLKGQYAPVVGLFIKQAQNNEALTIVGDGQQRRDFSHIDDVVTANIIAITKEIDQSLFGQVYNVASGKNYSINEIASMVSDNFKYIPSRIGEATETLGNTDKINKVFGWNSTVDIKDWINNNL
jgi:UDP-glucose 4-epimerase